MKVRADYVFGTISTTGGISAAATTFDSAALARLPAVASPAVAPITFYDAATGAYEVAHVTAHTASATSATIVRAQEGSTAAAWGEAGTWLHGPTVRDFTTRSVNAQTGTSYTLALADQGGFVTMTNAAASTLTVPPNSSTAFPVGTFIEGAQLGAGQVTLTPGVGVTINATPGLKVAAQYGTFGLLKTATDTWLAMGRLAA